MYSKYSKDKLFKPQAVDRDEFSQDRLSRLEKELVTIKRSLVMETKNLKAEFPKVGDLFDEEYYELSGPNKNTLLHKLWRNCVITSQFSKAVKNSEVENPKEYCEEVVKGHRALMQQKLLCDQEIKFVRMRPKKEKVRDYEEQTYVAVKIQSRRILTCRPPRFTHRS